MSRVSGVRPPAPGRVGASLAQLVLHEARLVESIGLDAQLRGVLGATTVLAMCDALGSYEARPAPHSTRILGRRMAPFSPFRIHHRAPHGLTQDPSTDQSS